MYNQEYHDRLKSAKKDQILETISIEISKPHDTVASNHNEMSEVSLTSKQMPEYDQYKSDNDALTHPGSMRENAEVNIIYEHNH